MADRVELPLKYNEAYAYRRKLVKLQGDACAICHRTVEACKGRLVCDHDHATGNIRGMLCHQCNAGLGNFGDDETRLLSAIAYLKRGCLHTGHLREPST